MFFQLKTNFCTGQFEICMKSARNAKIGGKYLIT